MPQTYKPKRRKTNRGSALLAVLWLSAALGAIAFSVAVNVRGEISRVATGEEDVRAYYLAEGAIQRAILHMEWSQSGRQDPENPYFVNGQPQMAFQFPSGNVLVDVIPETSKLSLNTARPEVLEALMLQLGAGPEQAATTAAAIVDWRTPHSLAEPTAFDQLYLSKQPSFQAAHASFRDVEDLLFVEGMTPDLFYGSWARQTDNGKTHLVPRPGVRDCVSVYGSVDRFDVNTVPAPVLAAIGIAPDQIEALIQRRTAAPFLKSTEFASLAESDPALMSHLALASHTIYTFRATARMRRPDGSFSDLKRTVSATVKFLPPGKSLDPFHILRWYDRG